MDSRTFYTFPAQEWTEAQPIGNGSIGAMVFGKTDCERICFNHDTLWSGKPKKITKEGAYEAFLEVKRLAFEGDYEQAHQVASERFLTTNSEIYLPFGDMLIDFGEGAEVSDYSRSLDFASAVLTTTYKSNRVSYKREHFISYPDDVFVMKLSADKKGAISFDLSLNSQLKYEVSAEDGTLVLDGECPGYSHADDPRNVLIYEYSDTPSEKGVQFRGGVRVIAQSGKTQLCENSIRVSGADEALILFTIETSFTSYDKHPYLEAKEYKTTVLDTLDKAEKQGYDSLLARHLEDYGSLYSKISLELGTSGRENMPTDERLKLFNEDKNDISLYTLMFDFGRYLTIASSREGSQATNLQGIWNCSITPPWRSNYTVNINTEMNYFPTLMCGLEGCFEPLIRFMKDRSVAGELTAKAFYNARGFVIHHNSDIWAHTNGVSSNAQYGFWNGASGWLCHNLYDYYEYTLDKQYLSEVCYPIMKKASEFYLDLLCERGDGKYSICPATSPENAFWYDDGKKRSSVAKYTAMSDAIAYELFGNCKKAMEILGVEDDSFAGELDHALANMSPFAVDSTGRLMEWNEEFAEVEVTHRHISHLYALHPAHLITPEDTPELAQACKKTIEVRGDAGTGWSLGWKINFLARLNEGDHALKLIDMQLNYVNSSTTDYRFAGGTYPNLFDAHPPFQIDGNFGAVSGIIEMLVDTRNDKLVLLPALPSKWQNGKLCGVRVKGNRILDIEWENGKLKSCVER